MTVREHLLDQLHHYDDDAWAALANRGLLRRARRDLESGPEPREVPGEDDRVRVVIGAQTVTFDARGPAQAACTCPSVTVCQHVVAAGLWLAETAGAGVAATETVAGAESEPSSGAASVPAAPPSGDEAGTAPADDLHAALMSFDDVRLAGHAGKAGLRWAQTYVAGLDAGDVQVVTGGNVAITLPHPRVTFRFMGGGPEALVPDVRLPVPERYAVAAVLAYQAAHGAVVVAPERRERTPDARLAHARSAVRTSITRLLEDTVLLGIAHASTAIGERYSTAAVSAQGVEYHRLARLLRGLGDHVELLVARTAGADEQRVLDDAALAYALVTALGAAEDAGTPPVRLLGVPRQRYESHRSVDLIGLGAAPWRSPSGYQGLTALFWWPAAGRFASVTDARPVGLAFDPRARYSVPGPWAGLDAPARASGARVRLTGARATSGGRLSAAEGTQASVVPATGAEITAALPIARVWADIARPSVSLLDEPDSLRDWAVLQPTGFTAPRYDAATQTLMWALIDAADDRLELRVPYSPLNAALVERLEAIGRSGGPPVGTLVVARLRPGPAGLTGEPLSLVHPAAPPGAAVEALHFPTDGAPRAARRAGRSAGGRAASEAPRGADLPPELVRARAALARVAERGTGGGTAILGDLSRCLADANAAGMPVFRQPGAGGDPRTLAGEVLRIAYLFLQTTALAGVDGSAPEDGTEEPSEGAET